MNRQTECTFLMQNLTLYKAYFSRLFAFFLLCTSLLFTVAYDYNMTDFFVTYQISAHAIRTQGISIRL